MDPVLEAFHKKYQAWVEDSLEEYQAHIMDRIVRTYPFVSYPDIPWTPFQGQAADHTFALVTSGGLYLKDRQPPFETESIHGEPHNVPRQRRIILDALQAFTTMREPGARIELPYRWKRPDGEKIKT